MAPPVPTKAAVREFKARLMGGFPPGVWAVLDAEDDPGKLLEGLAALLITAGDEQVKVLRRELNPLTATIAGKLPDWERALDLSATEVALFGNQEQRRNQVIARLRERGPMTYGLIRSVVGPLLDYADPSVLQILEVDRDILRALHTYTWTGSVAFPTPIAIAVLDDAFCGPTGVQIDLTGTTANLAAVTVEVVSPGGVRTVNRQPPALIGRGPLGGMGPAAARLCFPEFEGVPVFGAWTITVSSLFGGTLTQIDIFAEGFGRDAAGNDGRGSQIFEWGVMLEPALAGPNLSIKAADAAIARINYATRRGELLFRTDDVDALPPGDLAAIPDNVNAIPDRCIPGAF